MQSAEVRFGPALKALMMCLLIGGAAVGYVFQKEQVRELGQEEHVLRVRLERLRLHNGKLATELARMESPAAIERAVRRHHLDLGLPHPAQVVVLPAPGILAAPERAPLLPHDLAVAGGRP